MIQKSSKIKFSLGVFLACLLLTVIFSSDHLKLRILRETKYVRFVIERFSTNSLSLLGSVVSWTGTPEETVLTVPLYKQKYSLSCEIASLRMALAYKWVYVEEDELIKDLIFVTKNPPTKDMQTGQTVWGDPNLGFVGAINGKMPVTGYGVYEKPILDLALKYRKAEILFPATLETLVYEISRANPVVVWGSLTDGKDISWTDYNGNKIKAVAGEHARVAIGFRGPKENPTHIVLIDPVYGEIDMATEKFLKDWDLLENKGVVVY